MSRTQLRGDLYQLRLTDTCYLRIPFHAVAAFRDGDDPEDARGVPSSNNAPLSQRMIR